jgi:peptidyl-tRNA hydrolase, PTH1 family
LSKYQNLILIDKFRIERYFWSMLIIYGLGNNEEKYLKTKHNIGRIVLENLAQKYEIQSFQKKNLYSYAKSQTNESVYFLYSNGYMNTSGEPLLQFLKYHNLDSKETQILIIHDDSDQVSGSWKLVQGGRSGGQKGIDNIHKHILNTQILDTNIWRLKIGIRPEHNLEKSEHFVLKPLSQDDDRSIDRIVKICSKQIENIIQEKWHIAQNHINTKEKIK